MSVVYEWEEKQLARIADFIWLTLLACIIIC